MKDEVVRFRLNSHEKIIFVKNAKKMNMSMTEFFKYCCLIKPPLEDVFKRENFLDEEKPGE